MVGGGCIVDTGGGVSPRWWVMHGVVSALSTQVVVVDVVGVHGRVGWGSRRRRKWWLALVGCPWCGSCVVDVGGGGRHWWGWLTLVGRAWGGACVIDAGSGGWTVVGRAWGGVCIINATGTGRC